MSPILEKIRATAVAALNLARVLLPELLPEGRFSGNEYIALNPVRGDRNPGSFSVNWVRGVWNDHADPDAHGGDLVGLVAYLLNCSNTDAARHLDQRLGLGIFSEQDAGQLAQRMELLKQQAQAREQKARQEKEAAHQRAGAIANKLWRQASPEIRRSETRRAHPYLQRKRVEALNTRALRQRDGFQGRVLLVPLCDSGRLVNLQFVDEAGNKGFIPGGRVLGCYCPLGLIEEQNTVYVCEGWATGATLLATYGGAVACAMFAANLEPVALKLRQRYGDQLRIVIAGDDDRGKKRNAGREFAAKAAEAAGAELIFPEFPSSAPLELSDFNDLHLFLNQEPVQRRVARG